MSVSVPPERTTKPSPSHVLCFLFCGLRQFADQCESGPAAAGAADDDAFGDVAVVVVG